MSKGFVDGTGGISWSCHVCGDTRLDEKIDVARHPITLQGTEVGTRNVRYCNDKQKCIDVAYTESYWQVSR